MTKEQIEKTLEQGERLTLEVKTAASEIPKSVWETYSAFANTIGGDILLGIREHIKEQELTKRFELVGVADARKIVSDFWNTVNSNKVSHNVLLDKDVQVIDCDGISIVHIHVPQADWRVKPVFLNDNVYKGAYKRNHEGDYHCTESEVKAMIRDANEDGNDGVLLDGFTMEDIDRSTLHGYRIQFRTLNGDHIWNDHDDQAFLKDLGGYATDRLTHKQGLTAAGLMMFGKGEAIRERFANFRMDYLDMSHLEGEQRYRDRLTYDGRWENNLYQFFRLVMPKLTFDLPRPFVMKGIQRQEDTPQIKAVREAFTNAIIHCDLFMSGGILRIEKHDHSLCLRNPGSLKLPIAQILEGGNSKARNPRIQNMLRMIGYGENIGSGFPKIVHAWKQAKWDCPILEDCLDLNEVKLTLPVPYATETVSDTKDIGDMSETKLSERQKHILMLIQDNPHITAKEMSVTLSVTQRTIERDLAAMKSHVRHEGKDNDGFWTVIKKN